MPQKSKLKLPPLDLGPETIGQRIARLRKEKGYTQSQLAEKMGLVQALVSEYERGKIRLYDEMIARFALALDVSTDTLIGLKKSKNKEHQPSLKIIRRLLKIEELPTSQQKILFNIIDTFFRSAEAENSPSYKDT